MRVWRIADDDDVGVYVDNVNAILLDNFGTFLKESSLFLNLYSAAYKKRVVDTSIYQVDTSIY